MDFGGLDELLVDNLQDLDAAATRIDELLDLVTGELCTHLEAWADRVGWRVNPDWDDPWACPPEWMDADDSHLAWFGMDWTPSDRAVGATGETYFDLSRLLGVSGSGLSLIFDQRISGARKKGQLAAQEAEALKLHGFSPSNKAQFHLPCTLDPKAVTAALKVNDWTEAFEPVQQALDRALAAKPAFDRLIKNAGRL